MSQITDQQIKASILEFLMKKGRWGAHYYPLDTMIRWLGKKVMRNGKRVRVCLKDLVNEGYVLIHKRGEAVSLNPAMSEEIIEFIRKVRI
ncbi:MAG: hypothetical protein NDF58_06360 [archaeon YNP-LCB-024-027]|jgi:hypothetical protein|nr:hypothetical protein [Candidatus Culexarchaeum yellowstonense]